MSDEIAAAAKEYRKAAATTLGLMGICMAKGGNVKESTLQAVEEWMDKTEAASKRLDVALEQNGTGT